jgi:phage tail-like protein
MSPSARRMDPYKSFKFRIMWDGEYIAGASLITGLEPSSVADLDAAGSPGDVQHEPVVLEGVVTSDQDFLDWARIKTSPAPEPAADDDDSRQIVVEQYTGDSLHAPYTLYRCWVSEFQALSDLDANAAMVAIELCSWTMKGCMCGRVAGGSSWLRLRDTPGRPVPSTSEVHETEGDRVLFTRVHSPSPVCCFDWPSYYTSQEVDYSLQCRFLECHTGESGARCGVDHMDAHTVLPKSWTR